MKVYCTIVAGSVLAALVLVAVAHVAPGLAAAMAVVYPSAVLHYL